MFLGYSNIVNEELKAQVDHKLLNVLSREMQLSLRKRKVDFTKTNNAMQELAKELKKRKLIQEAKEGNNNYNKETVENKHDVNISVSDDKEIPINGTEHGCVTDEDIIPLRIEEKKTIDFKNKLYLAPLTTVCFLV